MLGDHTGRVIHLGERDCSIQRRHQKVVEIAPAASLDPGVREQLTEGALRVAREAGLQNASTIEFLVKGDEHWFIEANARLQVEHTITEEVTGVDLVQAQLRLAAGETLSDLGLDADVLERGITVRGFAVQARVNLETISADGTVRPTGGVLKVFEPAAGPGVRTDTYASSGYQTNPSFDSLLAKVIGHAPNGGVGDALDRTSRALRELRVDGVETNVAFLQAILAHPDVRAGLATTDFVDRNVAELVAVATATSATSSEPLGATDSSRRAGAVVDASDPLAVLAHGKSASAPRETPGRIDVDNAVLAPIQGTIVSVTVIAGDEVRFGQPLLVMEAMKMEHVIESTMSGVVHSVTVAIGDTVFEGHPLVVVESDGTERVASDEAEAVDLEVIRPDLAEALERQAKTHDAARPDAVARRVATHQRTARENVDDLCDPGSFVEYGSLVIAAQRRRRTMDDLIARTPADGLVAGIGRVNGASFPDERGALHRDVVRLHGARGHPGATEPPQEGPAVRARRAPAASGRLLHRGRRRAARRHRWHRTRRARLHGVQPLRCPERPRTSRRDQLRPLLRRQRGVARLLRRRDRDRGLEHRDGRPSDDRRRRPRRVPSRRGRPDVGAGAERRRRRRGRRRSRGRRASRSSTSRTSKDRSRDWECADQRLLRVRHPGEPAARLRHPQRHRDDGRHGLGARAAAATSGSG